MSRTMACCVGCRNGFDRDEMIPSYLANRGGRISYICQDCIKPLPFLSKNNKVVGTGKKGFNFTWEIEYQNINEDAICQFLEYDWLVCQNGRVGETGVVLRSPIHTSLKSIHKQFITIDNLVENGNIETNEKCKIVFKIKHFLMKELKKNDFENIIQEIDKDFLNFKFNNNEVISCEFDYKNHDEFMEYVNLVYDIVYKILNCKVEKQEDAEKVSKKVQKIYKKYVEK